ncbi:MAG: DUF928 domain-containing protein [Prochlorotrichaceae cyanobacterium]
MKPILVVFLTSISLLSSHLIASAQEDPTKNLVFPPGSENDPPSRTVGTGTRGDCTTGLDLQGFVPSNHVGSTMQSLLTLYFYIPQGIQDPIVFQLNNTRSDEIVKKQIIETKTTNAAVDEPNQPKLLSIPLEFDQSLDRSSSYQWILSLACDPTNEVQAPSISGAITWEPLDDTLWQSIENLPLMDRPLALADEGLAYDAIDALFQWKAQDSDNPTLSNVWKQLLPQMPEQLVP